MKRALDLWQRLRGRLPRRLGGRLRVPIDLHVSTEQHGSDYGGFLVHPLALGPGSVVYSGGVGEDISFDRSLIERYDVIVHAFDPTPRSISWIAAQRLPPGFNFYPWALSGRDGVIEIFPPRNPAHVSHAAVAGRHTTRAGLRVPARRLGSIMAELGHDHIDLLKLDVEGAEYDVLKDLLAERLNVQQIVVEFHHHFPAVPRSRTTAALADLAAAGYRVIAVSSRGFEVTLLRVSVPSLTGDP